MAKDLIEHQLGPSLHATDVKKTEMHLPMMLKLLGETRKKINGMENCYERGQRTNNQPSSGMDKGSQSQGDSVRSLNNKQQLASNKKCYQRLHDIQEERAVHREFTS